MTVDLSRIDCVAYERVSTDQQAGEKQTSIADQDKANAALARTLKRTIGHTFVDKGVSGATMDQRPGLRELVDSCLAAPKPRRAPGYVLVLNDSRWGRFPNPEEGTYWRFHLERAGWIVRFAENDDTDNKNVRNILRAVVSSQATQKRDDVRANALRGARGTASQGFWIGQAPFGYRRKVVFPPGRERVLDHHARKAPDEKMMLAVDEGEAVLVRQMFAMYASGQHSINTIADWLLRTAPGRKWNRASVRYTLTNPAYAGDVVWGRTPADDAERAAQFIRPEGEWYGKRDAHEPIVSRELFARVQQVFRANRARPRGVRSDWIVSSIVKCRCGSSFGGGSGGSRRKDGTKVRFYACTTQSQNRAARCVYGGAVTKRYLEDAVLSTLGDVIGSELFARDLAARFDRQVRAARQSGRTVDVIDRDIAAVRQRQERLVQSIEAGAITTLDAKARMTALREEVMRLTVEREQVAARQVRPRLDAEERERLVSLALDFRSLADRLKGPALRELIRPWIQHAEFNTETRELTMAIRRIPARMGVSVSPLSPSSQNRSSAVVVRTVKISGRGR